eukprot:m.122784 g.122784  ORF g.122784 m.122784 type:complete len:51 (+) comp14431_c0_seq3:328-480(+)
MGVGCEQTCITTSIRLESDGIYDEIVENELSIVYLYHKLWSTAKLRALFI